MSKPEEGRETEALVRVLTAHYNSLVSAEANGDLLRQYSVLLRFLRRHAASLFREPPRGISKKNQQSGRKFNAETLRTAPLEEIERIVNGGGLLRKDLEQIAIERFSVPSGSMRSFANREMLVDKLATLINNERAHRTIGVVARDQKGSEPDPS
jgi:hypothetical protein